MVNLFKKQNNDTTDVKIIINGKEIEKISFDTKPLSKLFIAFQKHNTKSMVFDMHKKTIFLELEAVETKKK